MSDYARGTPVAPPIADGAPPEAESRGAKWRYVAGRFLRSKSFVIGAVILVFWLVMAVAWPVVVPHDPQAIDAMHTLNRPLRHLLVGD